MAYEFAGFFARPAVLRPTVLPNGAVWREIEKPFVGIGVRLPNLMDDEVPSVADVEILANALGLRAANCWLYLTYVCWGGDIDFVYGFGFRGGTAFGPVKESEYGKVEAAFTGLMEQFGVPTEVALRFEPFERGYWGE